VNFEESLGFIAPLQLKRFNFGSKMAITASATVLPNQKKKSPDSLTCPRVRQLIRQFGNTVVFFLVREHLG
jgi:hypothetical protein